MISQEVLSMLKMEANKNRGFHEVCLMLRRRDTRFRRTLSVSGIKQSMRACGYKQSTQVYQDALVTFEKAGLGVVKYTKRGRPSVLTGLSVAPKTIGEAVCGVSMDTIPHRMPAKVETKVVVKPDVIKTKEVKVYFTLKGLPVSIVAPDTDTVAEIIKKLNS